MNAIDIINKYEKFIMIFYICCAKLWLGVGLRDRVMVTGVVKRYGYG